MAYILNHLMYSGLHNLSYEQAVYKMINHDWTEAWERYLDTWKDREVYRKQIAISKEPKNADRAGGVTESVATRQTKRRCKMELEEERKMEFDEIEELQNIALAAQLREMRDSDDITAIIRERQKGELKRGASFLDEPNRSQVVSTEQCRSLRDVLVRADSALKHAKHRCLECASELHKEQLAVRDATIAVDRIMCESQR
jgi:hypothetical protein